VVRNPNTWDRLLDRMRRAVIGRLGGRTEAVT
jgi:hypothetical protein